jgi:hypothetical protein
VVEIDRAAQTVDVNKPKKQAGLHPTAAFV